MAKEPEKKEEETKVQPQPASPGYHPTDPPQGSPVLGGNADTPVGHDPRKDDSGQAAEDEKKKK